MRVWAPFGNSVDIETRTESQTTSMTLGDGGWWFAESLPAESHYRFVVDGVAVPDPRSQRQPEGPTSWSCVVDHDAFRWSDATWKGLPLASAVIYEMHIGTFSPQGTFVGAIDKLDHLVELGITALEIMPVASFTGVHGWGYDGVSLYAPHEPYGGPDGLKQLIDACHQRGIAVIIDVVYNHLGPVGNCLSTFGPYFTTTYHTPWGAAVNFDGSGSDEVRRFVLDNAAQWIVDYHADGLRLDAIHALHDETPVHIVEELGREVQTAGRRLGRTVWVIAESDLNDPKIVRATEAFGYGLDAAWSDDFHHSLHVALTADQDGYYSDFAGLADLAEVLQNVFVYSRKFSRSRGRTHGAPVGNMDRSRFICFSQNHDQIGNRAVGDRLHHFGNRQRAQIAAAIVLTAPFVPMLFQGEEWGSSAPFQYFTDIDDEEVGNAVREGRRSEFTSFGWEPESVPDPQDPETFRRSKLDWSELAKPEHASMLAWYRSLLRLRAATPTLRDDRPSATTVAHDLDSQWLVVGRGEMSIVVNLGPPQTVPLGVDGAIVLTNDAAHKAGSAVSGDGVTLDTDCVAIVQSVWAEDGT